MTKIIKQRIAMINSGVVPEGYKKIKIGIVPNEWNEYNIGKFIVEYKKRPLRMANILF